MSAHGTEPNTEPLLFPDPVIEAYLKDVDRTLLREQLRRPMPQRFESLTKLVSGALELRRQMSVDRGNS